MGGIVQYVNNNTVTAEDKEVLRLFSGINHNITTASEFNKLEIQELAKEQVSTPVRHIFGAGIYVRELSAPAGTFLIGHMQKTAHMNVMVKGRVLILIRVSTLKRVIK